ncbi:MAG: orotidine-5-phosphate decarboxylase [Candidatus Saccharibacteria bacterium]|nr:orotidine-5-phosphate decarboxylase [Candidatus Saccharibacteria bacterium]
MLNLATANLSPEQSIALALDTTDLHQAELWIRSAKAAGLIIVKNGIELDYGHNPKDLSELAADYGMEWIADLKTLGIAKTVGIALPEIVNLPHQPVGITMSTQSGVESLKLAQAIAGERGITIFGVALLSSIDQDETLKYNKALPRTVMWRETQRAVDAGVWGLVSSGEEIARVKRFKKTRGLTTLVVGTRSEGVVIEGDDQRRVTSIFEAANAGADLIEIGRQATAKGSVAETALRQVGREIAKGRIAMKQPNHRVS